MNLKVLSAALVAILLVGAGALIVVWSRMPVKQIPEGWSVISGSPDQWRSENGKILGHSTTGESLLVSREQYREVTMSAIVSSTREASFAVRCQDAMQGYLVIYVPANNTWRPGTSYIELVKVRPDNAVTLKTYEGRVLSSLGPNAKIGVTAKGEWLEVFLNDVSVIRTKDTTYSTGFIGLRVYGWDDHPCTASYSSFRFR